MPDFTSPSFQRPRYAVLVNILWFLSLVVALMTASLGILVKQWFHELLSYKTHDPKERLKIRFFREAGLERWKVHAIASSLPLLLQLALLLFFIGLALFLLQQDPVVAWVTTVVMILWLAVFAFTIVMPMFASQCPYKTPFLKDVISQLRVKLISLSWLRDLADRVCGGTSIRWVETLSYKLHEWSRRVCKTWESLEEGAVCKDGSLSIPVISFARDLLQGERLQESLVECIRDISADDMKKTSKQIGKRSSPMNRIMLPATSHGPAGVIGSLALEVAHADHLRPLYFGKEMNPSLSATLYLGLTILHNETYDPSTNYLISSQSLPAFIRLFQEDSTSVAFSFLTMYSIRHRTLTDHPNSFDDLFWGLSESGRLSHGIGKLTIPSPSPLQLIKHSQGTNSYRTYSQQQNPSSVPFGTDRKTSRMAGRLQNVSKRFGPMLMSPILFARLTRFLSSLSLL